MKRKKFGRGLATFLLILLIIALGYLLYTYFYGGSKEDKIERKLIKMTKTFYEEYYYDALVEEKGSKDNAIVYLSKYADKGLKISFGSLKEYFDTEKGNMNYTELMDCNENDTRAIIYPKSPYGKTDYSIKIKLACDVVEQTGDSVKFKKEYEKMNNLIDKVAINVDKDNLIKYSSLEEINKKIDNNDSFVIFFGSPYFNESRYTINAFIEASKEYGIEEIYYVDLMPEGKEENDIRTAYGLNENGEVYKTREGSDEYNKFISSAKELLPNPYEEFINNSVYAGEKTILNAGYIYVKYGVPVSYTDGRPAETQDYSLVTKERFIEIFKEFYSKGKTN